jgi:hypothetical protein
VNLWNEIVNVASFMLVAAVAAVLVYGILIPAANKAPFGQDSLNRNPKLQYSGLVVLSVALDANTLFGGWVGTIGDWLNSGGAFVGSLTVGQTLTGVAGAGLLIFWTAVMVPNKLEPTNLGVPGHFVMWGVSLLVYPMVRSSIGVTGLVAIGIVLGIAAVSNAKGGSRASAYA